MISDEPPINEALLGGGGYAVRCRDVEALSTSVARLLSNASLRETLATRGKRAVLDLCSPERFVESYQNIYDWLLGADFDPAYPGEATVGADERVGEGEEL